MIRRLPQAPWHGLTIDDVDAVPQVLFRLRDFQARPFFRLVIDFPERPLTDYDDAIRRLSERGDVMVQVRDSYSESADGKPLSVEGYAQLFTTMIARWKDQISLWEIGNEVDGDWLAPDIADKVRRCMDIATEAGVKTAVTFFLEKPGRMARWAKKNGIRCDIAMISWYPLANKRFLPDWETEVDELSAACGNVRVACGEFGSENDHGEQLGDTGTAMVIRTVQGIRVRHTLWVGGWFFWDFCKMCLPKRNRCFSAWQQTV